MNLRHIPKLVIDLERFFECALCKLLNELSAPQRLLIIDGADAVTEDKHDIFKYLVNSAKASFVKVIAVTSIDSKEAVSDILNECFGSVPQEYVVSQLDESKIDKLIKGFPELEHLNANPRSRKILRRLVVVDLLVRGQTSGIPLTDADAMNEVWTGLVRRHEKSDRGLPDAREIALLKLAKLEFGEGERLDVLSDIDPSALNGLCRDGLLRNQPSCQLTIGPGFAHDEVRRYAVARFLLASDNSNPGLQLLKNKSPRWSLSAARLACQAWLGRLGPANVPLRGQFSELQASFDELVKKGHASRWGDVPTEALLMLAHPEALLRDAWPHLLAKEGAGLQRLFRLAKQQLYNKDGNIDIIAVEPIIKILLEETTLWQFREQFREPVGKLLVSWLRSHIAANTPGRHPLRLLLQQHLMDVCAGADRRFDEERQAKAAERAAYTPEAVEHGRQRQEKDLISDIGPGSNPSWQWQKEIPNEITDELVLELLALLGSDRGEEGEAILMRVARDAPHYLAPAVDDLILGRALLKGRSGLLADLTQAYYLDKDVENAGFSRTHSGGVRPHRKQLIHGQRSAFYLGPFIPLFQLDFCNGVRVLNRLLNHAARIRVIDLVRGGYGLLPQSIKSESLKSYENKLKITTNRKSYIGDEHVWCWYRGTGVGPDPCSSALQALEIVCDQMLKEINVPLKHLVTIMLYDCENLAMLGLIVGLLIRHLEKADNLLDPFLIEPLIWHYEFVRAHEETSGLAARSDHLDSSERRKWSFQEAAVLMVVSANAERRTKLHALGDMLISNAQQLVKIAPDHNVCQKQEGNLVPIVRNWASRLDHSTYQTRKVEGDTIVETRAPDDIVQALQETSEAANLTIRAFKLLFRYSIKNKEMTSKPINLESLIDDIAFVKHLLNNPVPLGRRLLDIPALVAASALKINLVDRISLPDDVLLFSVEILLRTGEDVINRDQPKNQLEFDENTAECSAARILPLLLLPVSAQLRNLVDQESGSNTFQRAVNACFNLARVMTYEVRLYLSRGLDHLWKTPACANNGSYHHELGWQMVIEMMRPCVIGPWNPETRQRPIVALNEPIIESLASIPGASIRVDPLDTAIRALAPAAMARICISRQAKDLLLALLAAQQRALLADKAGYYRDPHGLQTLVSARALLTLARDGDDVAIKAIYDYIDTYANNLALLENFLSALSAAAEEAPDRAETAGKLWPNLFRHVLHIILSRDISMEQSHNDMILASLIPNHIGKDYYSYSEFSGNPIQWWKSLELKAEIEEWLLPAAGNHRCVDYMITYLDTFEPDKRAFVGLPWIEKLIEPDPEHIAQYSIFLPYWLIEVRESATTNDQTLATWQRIVDQLTVAGVAKLAQYSD